MSDFFYDLWLAAPGIGNPGFLTAMGISGLVCWRCFKATQAKMWPVLLKSIVLSCLCLLSLIFFAMIGVMIISSGEVGPARSWSAFGDGYLWGAFLAPCLAFGFALSAYMLTQRKQTHVTPTD